MEKTYSLLAPVIRRLGIEDGVRLARIQASWEELFEQSLTRHMSPSRLSEGELLINVDSPLWMQQLTYCKGEIIKKLGTLGVREVRFRIGKIHTKRTQETEPASLQISPEDAGFVQDLISGIGDEELRTSIKSAAERSLSLRRESTRTRPASRR